MSDLLDLASDSLRHWFSGHGTTCGWILLLVGHQYLLQFNMRRVIGMRPGDGLWMMPPRESQAEKDAGGRPWWKWILFTVFHPKKPKSIRARPKTMPPQAPPAQEQPQADFHDAVTPKIR